MGGNAWKWVLAIATPLVSGLLLFVFTRPGGLLNPKDPPPRGGDISEVQLSDNNPCCTYSVNFTLKGFKGQTAHIRAYAVDAASGQPAGASLSWPAKPDADEDQALLTAHVPQRRGKSYVTFELVDPHGTVLDRKNTSPITVR